jgi:hypothetical protein
MFAITHTIDTIQNVKKQILQNAPIEKKAQEALISWIDNQTAYTKKATQTCSEATTQYAKEAQEAMTALWGRVNQNILQDFWTQSMRMWQRA